MLTSLFQSEIGMSCYILLLYMDIHLLHFAPVFPLAVQYRTLQTTQTQNGQGNLTKFLETNFSFALETDSHLAKAAFLGHLFR